MKATCTIEGCTTEPGTIRRGFCDLHYYRWQKYGDPNRPTQIMAKRNGDVWRYATAHQRLRKARGKADTYACEHCGKRARHWAYDGEDEHERIDAVDGRRVFSVDFEHYLPLCQSCHTLLDQERFRTYRTPREEFINRMQAGKLAKPDWNQYARPARPPFVPKPCPQDECGKPVVARGLCSTHYAQGQRARRRAAKQETQPDDTAVA